MSLIARIAAMTALAFAGCAPALAQIAVHPVILDLQPGALQRTDFAVENPTSERVFVAVEPARIEAPGSAAENRVTVSDPNSLGLLVSPPRMILEPGERRFVRVAALALPGEADRIFRVAVRPVAGEVTGQESGLKVLVGYDLLVIQRPAAPSATLDWEDRGTELVIRNTGNSNLQLVNGKACREGQRAESCAIIPPARLYAGNAMTVAKETGQILSYDLIFMGRARRQVFQR